MPTTYPCVASSLPVALVVPRGPEEAPAIPSEGAPCGRQGCVDMVVFSVLNDKAGIKVRGLPYQRSVLSTLSDASQYNQRTRMIPYVRHRECPYVTAALVHHIETQTQRIPVPLEYSRLMGASLRQAGVTKCRASQKLL